MDPKWLLGSVPLHLGRTSFQQQAYVQSPPRQLKAVLDVVPAGDLGALCGEHWWWLGLVTTSCNPSSTTAADDDDYSKTVTKFSLESLRKPFPRKYNYQRHLARRMSRYKQPEVKFSPMIILFSLSLWLVCAS